MPGKPIATLGSMHVCPLCSGTVPHVGGPASGPGAPNVLINGKPAALMGDICVCVGPPDAIAQGEPTVLINGTPVATQGSMTAHGGSIVQGEPTVMVSSATPNAKATMPLKKIPFPQLKFADWTGAALKGKTADMKTAQANIEALKRDAVKYEGEPKIIKVEWLSEDFVVKDSQMVKIVKVKATTINADDGVTVDFKVTRLYKENAEDQEELVEEVIELSGTVQGGEAIAEFEIEDYEQEDI